VRALAVLEFVTGSERPVSLADVMASTALPKPTAHRILVMLERERMLQREPDGKRYVAGPRLTALARDVLLNSFQRGPRHAILQSLVQEIGETCNFTMLDGNEVVYLDRVEAHWPLRMVLQPGSRVPPHCTASGKLFLSLLPPRKRQRLIGAAPLKRYTANTITGAEPLEQALAAIREEKVGTDDEEFLAGLCAISVPVLDRRGRVCAAVAVHAPSARMNIDQARVHLPALRRAAAALATTCADE
jgi:DNA-binding IclR family transcriptional regulator